MRKRFELKENGTIERVRGFGAYAPTIQATTKTEATAKFMAFAFRAIQNPPIVTARNGAWRLVSPTLDGGWSVESGTDERKLPLCMAHIWELRDLTDETASFAYYASEEYRNAA